MEIYNKSLEGKLSVKSKGGKDTARKATPILSHSRSLGKVSGGQNALSSSRSRDMQFRGQEACSRTNNYGF